MHTREKKAYFYKEWHSQRTTHCTRRDSFASDFAMSQTVQAPAPNNNNDDGNS